MRDMESILKELESKDDSPSGCLIPKWFIIFVLCALAALALYGGDGDNEYGIESSCRRQWFTGTYVCD